MVVIVFRSRVRLDADAREMAGVGVRRFELASPMPGFVSYNDFSRP